MSGGLRTCGPGATSTHAHTSQETKEHKLQPITAHLLRTELFGRAGACVDREGGGAPLSFRDQRGLSVLLQWSPACPGKRCFELKLAPAASVSLSSVTKPACERPRRGGGRAWRNRAAEALGRTASCSARGPEELASKSWLLDLSKFDSDMSTLKSTRGPISQPSFLPAPPPPWPLSQDWAVGQRDRSGKGGT